MKLREEIVQAWEEDRDPAPEIIGEEPSERLITLATCAEISHTDDRNLVTGVLVSVVER